LVTGMEIAEALLLTGRDPAVAVSQAICHAILLLTRRMQDRTTILR